MHHSSMVNTNITLIDKKIYFFLYYLHKFCLFYGNILMGRVILMKKIKFTIDAQILKIDYEMQ